MNQTLISITWNNSNLYNISFLHYTSTNSQKQKCLPLQHINRVQQFKHGDLKSKQVFQESLKSPMSSLKGR